MLQNRSSLKISEDLQRLTTLDTPSATFASIVTNFAGGFVQGFSTINVLDEEPDHWAEQLANTAGFFLGFVGIIPGVGTAASGGLKAGVLAGRGIANSVRILGRSIAKEEAAGALINTAAKGVRANVNVGKYYTNVKSVPFYVSGKIMEKGKKLLSGTAAGKSAEKFLNKTVGLGTVGDILEGSANMALASAVSSWQGGVDQMMHSAAWGGFFGAGDRYISGIKALASQPFAARAVAGSLFNGLPSTAMGNPFEIQVFDYFVGGYFGTEMPYTQRKALEIINNNYKKPEDAWNLMTGMRQLPEYVNAEQMYGDHADIIREELNNQARLMFGKEGDHNTVVGMSILHSIRNEAAQKLLEQDPNMQQSAALDAATDAVLQHPVAMFAIKANGEIAKEMLMDENGVWHLDRFDDDAFKAQFIHRVIAGMRAGVPPANGSAPNNNVPPAGTPPGAPPAGGGGQPAPTPTPTPTPTPARKVKKNKKKSTVNQNVEIDTTDADLNDPNAGTADAVFDDPINNFDIEAEFAASRPVEGLFGEPLPVRVDPQLQTKKTRSVEEIENERLNASRTTTDLESTIGIIHSPSGKFGVAEGKDRIWFNTKKDAEDYVEEKYRKEMAEAEVENAFRDGDFSSIGTLEEYKEYLSTIFTDSKFREIVYHGSEDVFEEFDPRFQGKNDPGDLGPGFYFSPYRNVAKDLYGDVVYRAILNIKDPLTRQEAENALYNYRDQVVAGLTPENPFAKNDGVIDPSFEIVAFEPNQIHILGSKKDAEGFKQFLENKKIDPEIQKDLDASQEVNIESLDAQINKILDEKAEEARIEAQLEIDPVAAVEELTTIQKPKALHAIDDTRVHDSKNSTGVPQPHRVPREGLSENAQANLDKAIEISNDPDASMVERVFAMMSIRDKTMLEGMPKKDIDKRIEDIEQALEDVYDALEVTDPFKMEVQDILWKIVEHDGAEKELVVAQQSVKDTQPKPTDNAKVLSKTADLTDIIDTAIREKIQEGYQESLVEISTSPFARAAKNLVPRSLDPDKREGMFNEILKTLNDEFNNFLETPEGKRDHTIFIDELINKHADGLNDDQVKDIKKDLANIYFKIKHLNTVEQYVWDVTNGGLVQRNKMSGTKDLIEERRAPSFVDKLLTAYFEGRRSDEERKASPKYGRIHTSMVKLFESSKNVENDGQVSTVYDINEKSSIFDGVSGMGELMGVVHEMWKMGRSEGKMGKIHMGHLKAHGKLIFYDNLFRSHEEALSFLEKSIVGTKYEADYIANRDRFVKEAQEYFTAKGKEVDPNELRQSYEEIVANEIKLFTDIVNPGKTLADLEGKGFVNDFQKLNKRMQLLHAEGYWANEAVIRNQGIDDLTDAGYSVVVINSRNKSGISKRAGVEDSFFNTEQDGQIQRVVSETETDGAVIVRQDVYDAHVKDAGYDPDSGAMKTVIADQNQTDGALLSKHAMFRATDAQQAWMRENGVHMILHDTATKQLGSRKSYDSQVVDGTLRMFDPSGKEVSAASVASPLSISSISYNLSTRETVADQLKPQGIVKQLLRNLTASNVDQRVINQVFRDYIRRSVMGDDQNNTLFASAEKGNAEAIANLDVDNISIANIMKVVNGGRKANQDLYDKVIRHVMNYTKRVDPEDAQQAAQFYEQDLNGAAKIFASLGSLKVTPSMVDHLFVRKYFDNKLRGYISDRMESPVTPYSMKSIGMPSTGWDPPPREGLFRMGKAAKDFVVKSRAFNQDMTLGELWMAYEKTSDAKLKTAIEKDMEMIVIRVPSDSVSGARVLRFDGFSDYNGTGISLHSTDMAYLGGMDLDIDSAFIYQDLGKDSVIKQNEAKVGGRREIKIIDKSDITNAEGAKGAAKYNRKDNTIEIDRKFLKAKFAEKAWTKPRKLIEVLHGETIESYAQALPEDQFASYKDFEDFVISHEYQHSLYSRGQFNKENPNKTKGDYETEINRRALADLQKTKTGKDRIIHSGGATGSDTVWENIAAKKGIKLVAHSFKEHKTGSNNRLIHDNKELAKADPLLDLVNKKYLKKTWPTKSAYTNSLLRRNYFQVKDSEAVIAVTGISNGVAEGGTGWAVYMGIEMGKNVHVFDTNTNQWMTWDGKKFIKSEAPPSYDSFAGIGTRDISKEGEKAIQDYLDSLDGVTETVTDGEELSLQSELKRNAHQWERVLDDGTRVIQESKNREGAEFMEVQDVPKDQKNLMSMFDPYMQIMAGKNAHKGKNAVGYAASARNKIASFWHNVGDKPMARDMEGMNDAVYERFMSSNPELVRILEEYGGKDIVKRREQIIEKLNDFDLPKKERDELVKELESLPVVKITATFNKKQNLDRFFAMARQAMNYAADSSDVFDMIDPAKLSDKLFSEAFDTKLNVTVTQNKQTKKYTIGGIAKPREYGQHKAALDALNPYDYAKNRTLSVSQWLMNAREPFGKNDVTARTADYLFNLDHTWSTFEDGYVSGTMERKYMAKNAFIQKYQQLVNAFSSFGKKVSIRDYKGLNAKQKRNQAIKEGMYSLFQFDRKLSDKEVVRLSSEIESLQARVEEMKLPGDDGRSASKRDIAKVEKQIIYMKDLMDELILQDFADVSSYILLTRYIERAYDKINGDEKLTTTQKAESYAEQREIMSDIAEHAFAFKRRFKSISDNVETSEHLGKVQLLDKLKEVIGDYRNSLPTKMRRELFDVLMLSSFGQQNEAVLDKISRSMALIASGKGNDISLEQLHVEQKMQYESNATAMALYVDAIGHEGVRRYMTLYDNVTTYASRTNRTINKASIEKIARIGLKPNAAREMAFDLTGKQLADKANRVLLTKSDKNPQAMQEAKKLRQLDDEQESRLLGDC